MAAPAANAPTIPNLRKRWGELDTEWASWRDVYAQLSDFVLPFAGRFSETDRNLGTRRYGNIFDSTATRALNVLGAGLMSGMSSPARPWFRLGTADPELANFQPVKLWLNDVQRRMLDLFQRTNVYQFLHSAYLELGLYGTGATFLADDFENVLYGYPLTCGEYRISANYRGEVDTLARKFQKTVGQVVREFGIDRVSQATKSLYQAGNLDAWVTLYHLIEPRADRDLSRRGDALNMPFASKYWEEGAKNDEAFLRESGFEQFPAICPRWQIFGSDIYGNSPGMVALGDVKQLQHEQLRKAEAIDYQTRPPLQVPTALKNRDANMLPGGVTYYDSANPQSGIRSMWEVNLNLSYLQADIADVRERINACFFVDLFLMLQGQDRTQMTATEVAERHEEKLLMLGPTLERLHDEALNPLVERSFQRMLTLGLLPPPPEEMQGQEINVEFISMLAQAQRAVGVNSTDRFLMGLGTLAQMKPEALDKLDADEAVDLYADQLGVDPRMIVGNERVALIRQQRAQAQQAAAMAEMANSMSQTAANLGGIDTAQPNGLTDLMNLTSGYSLPQSYQ
ncbi:putative phage head-tail connector protein (P21) [Cupriavidus taiwanensis]|uniref:portal protein n=1 Tax=Cupriavidus taiwanensis TaxID=164546 RepID=UPI000E1AF54C|nr:portal protein [Cupriavidus taiwanensis]SPA25892.1 putative phage head-tail connector protein (P21) [Cupriavidus taiwanensis]